ncbi:TonB-dependent siderophore receptor [Gloeocapsa sp. PCC 7428]|uniref:TonB-dependent receptor n=1 Tax=Gloeocapsa sp. PCC 7428 TaxID=1173026 RepID=UPI0002A61238|nr:TonB-dependent receptor [Gloeocapsa sp. PCC 7428]AFZ28907.1 TonB-dependent siderophore receptor [Gloeocapsa sp. PCC 7428]
MTGRFLCSVQRVVLWSIVVSSCIPDVLNLSPAWAEQLETTQTEQPATTVDEWMRQIAQVIAQISQVEVSATETGLEIVLQTATGQITVPTTSIVGNDLIADIPNAVLALPEGQFQQVNPSEEVALVSVFNLPDNQVRVVITGINAPPKVAIATEPQGLVMSVTPEAEEDTIEIVVTGEQNEGYNPSSAATATRTDTPLRDVPASIQVIPQQVIEDQGRLRLSDAVRNNAPGVTTSNSYAGTGQGEFIIRGFRQNYNFRNGFRDGKFGFIADLSNVEQIEVLRGPASVLFGQVQPGGIVNVVTKQPLNEPTYTVSFTGGQFSFYRPEIDFSAPLTDDGSLRYRLNVAYQNAGSFRDFVNEERLFIAPVLQWDMSENTTLTLDFSYLYNDPVFDRGVVALSDGSLPLPIDRFLGYPSLDDYYETQYRAGYRLEHRFNENWQIRNAFFFASILQTGLHTDFGGALVDDRFLPRDYLDSEYLNENFGLQTDLIGRFTTGSIEHQLLIGVDLNRITDHYQTRFATLPPIDIFNPNYDVAVPEVLEPDYFQTIFTDNLGLYVQDQITVIENLKLLVGGRLDFAWQDQNLFGEESTQSDTAFSPRVGVVYQPIEPISLYASFNQSFFPVIGRSRTNTAFEPERGTQYEIGIKADINNNLSATLAAFDITKRNVLTSDPIDSNFSIQVGEQRSQGVEFNIAGEILPGWNLIAGYAYTDARVIQDNRIPEGDFLSNVPENALNLWTTYEIQTGNLQGLGFGLGLFFVGERQGQLPNSNLQLPSYVRADAALFYRRENWRAAINIQNLFDIEYYEVAQNRTTIYPGAPFNIRATVSYDF